MKTSWQRILKFSRAAQAYYSEETNKQTKLGYAIKRVTSQLEKIQADHFQRRDDISIDNASVDGAGILLTEADGRFRFTPDKLKLRNKQWRELEEADNYEIEPYFATDLPPDLSDDLREALTGFVIKQESALHEVKTGTE